ncbi:MAG: hypothetical protein ACU0DK_09060 [Pseudooceanicola sp.]
MTVQDATGLVTTGQEARFDKVSLIPPDRRGYAWIGAEVDRRAPFFFRLKSARKRRVLDRLRRAARDARAAGAEEANVFEAVLVPPGRGRYLRSRADIATKTYDAVLLLAFPDMAAARAWRDAAGSLMAELREDARSADIACAENARRIGPVDHESPGIFLFNYFVADSRARNLAVWEHTAGWFQQATGLDNSTLLVPEAEAEIPQSVINHCRWDGLGDIVPHLLFRPSFRSFVLKAFELNRTAAVPVLYRLA